MKMPENGKNQFSLRFSPFPAPSISVVHIEEFHCILLIVYKIRRKRTDNDRPSISRTNFNWNPQNATIDINYFGMVIFPVFNRKVQLSKSKYVVKFASNEFKQKKKKKKHHLLFKWNTLTSSQNKINYYVNRSRV